MNAVVRVPEQLGPLLRSARIERSLTQSQVAEQLGVSIQAVSRLERNAGRASFDRVHQLCRLFGVEVVLRTRSAVAEPTPIGSTEW